VLGGEVGGNYVESGAGSGIEIESWSGVGNGSVDGVVKNFHAV